MMNLVALISIIICLSSHYATSFFIGIASTKNPICIPLQSYLDNLNNSQPQSSTNANYEEGESTQDGGNDDDDDTNTLKANRFSKFAPDANALDANDFRSQLKENMKADLERRRAADPNRGNQPTKNYLAGL